MTTAHPLPPALYQLVEALPIPGAVLDPDGHSLFENKASLRMNASEQCNVFAASTERRHCLCHLSAATQQGHLFIDEWAEPRTPSHRFVRLCIPMQLEPHAAPVLLSLVLHHMKLLTPLSPREREVFAQLGLGRSAQEIAKVLHLSRKTVETHRLRLRKRLGASCNEALTRLAVLWVEGLSNTQRSSWSIPTPRACVRTVVESVRPTLAACLGLADDIAQRHAEDETAYLLARSLNSVMHDLDRMRQADT